MISLVEMWYKRGGKPERIPQDEIHIDGRRVGYCGTPPGSALLLLEPVAEATLYTIREKLDERDGGNHADRKIAIAPQMEPGEEDDFEDDADDDDD